jgi:DNA-binding LacI/PurR family transcriptional regulator
LYDAFARAWTDKGTRPTALIAMDFGPGVATLGEAFDQHRLSIPHDLSVILLGHVDIASQTGRCFDMVGSRHTDAATSLVQQLRDRLESPAREHCTVYLANHYLDTGTVRPTTA